MGFLGWIIYFSEYSLIFKGMHSLNENFPTKITEEPRLLPEFQSACEKKVKNEPRQIVAGLDETFFGDFIILVLIDLRSGYLLLEEVTEDRCFNIWYEKTKPRLEQLGIEVNHTISDRAKALIKMVASCLGKSASIIVKLNIFRMIKNKLI